MKLSKRLNVIDQMIDKKYDHIWDCCCDHGFLGLHLLNRNAGSVIHFVDTVQALMDGLSAQIKLRQKRSLNVGPSKFEGKWQVQCINAENIILEQDTRHLIIIAGVGGDLVVNLVNAIIAKHPKHSLDFIVCPVHHNYKVRQALITQKLGLVDEKIVKENKRFYEVVYVSTESVQSLSAVGSPHMWNFSRIDDNEYLKQTLAHYRRIERNSNENSRNAIQTIISDYEALTTPD